MDPRTKDLGIPRRSGGPTSKAAVTLLSGLPDLEEGRRPRRHLRGTDLDGVELTGLTGLLAWS